MVHRGRLAKSELQESNLRDDKGLNKHQSDLREEGRLDRLHDEKPV